MKRLKDEMTPKRSLLVQLAWLFALALAYALPAQAQDKAQAQGNDKDKACLDCHAALAQKKVVHAAVHMGCASCHAELDASAVPHKSKGKIAKGLSAEGRNPAAKRGTFTCW